MEVKGIVIIKPSSVLCSSIGFIPFSLGSSSESKVSSLSRSDSSVTAPGPPTPERRGTSKGGGGFRRFFSCGSCLTYPPSCLTMIRPAMLLLLLLLLLWLLWLLLLAEWSLLLWLNLRWAPSSSLLSLLKSSQVGVAVII